MACRCLVRASGPSFSGPESFFGAEAGVVFGWADGFFFHLRFGGGARVFELLLGGLPGVVGELSQSVQMPFDRGAGVVFVHSAVAAKEFFNAGVDAAFKAGVSARNGRCSVLLVGTVEQCEVLLI